ncbi:MAG: assimilatory sulfite reductase (NADPH) flavoprotein subunit [Lysinibacillus sp.]|nr:assimilatory sulfite reductase (NADPH) flavoprotein subunit [Lysinibacillus sp.]
MLEVNNSPFNEKQVQQLNELLATLTTQQKIWLTGFLSASVASGTVVEVPKATQGEAAPIATNEPVSKNITILYGSQTGNAQKLAENFGEQLKNVGFDVTVQSMSDFKTNGLKKLQYLLVIASTHGEGEPPDNAISFHSFLHGKRAPKLEHVKFAVLSLGDSSYEYFCQTGKDFDAQLEKLGAERIVERVDCDLDYAEPAEKWFEAVKEKLQGDSSVQLSHQEATATVLQETVTYNRKNPFSAEIIEKINLNAEGSNKETIHLELSLENSGITFEPGDSLAIIPINNENLVHSLISALKFDATTNVVIDGESITLEEALTKVLEITLLTKPLMRKLADYTENKEFHKLISDEESVKAYIFGRDLLDVVETFGPFKWDAQSFVNLLRKMPARQYSISSSLSAYPEEVHVTVGVVRYEVDERERLGVCSTYIADQLEVGDKVQVYIQQNPNFRLPNDETPIIMIGPGTGVAPFRSFIQEREERGATGENWLFFGDQHFVTDFLYQKEWLDYLKSGVLTKMDVAFSRDQPEKVYVQHKMLKRSAELYEWLERGAVVYVCGDKGMAKDVEATLLQIIEKEGNKTEEEAKEYIEKLRSEKRYQRDVY